MHMQSPSHSLMWGPVLIQSNVAVLNLWNHHQENGVLQTVVPSHGLISNPQYQRDNYCWRQILHKLRGLYSYCMEPDFPPFARLQRHLGWCSTIASRFRVSWSQVWEKNIQAQTLKIQGGLVGPCRKKVVMKRKKYSTNHCYVECCHIKNQLFQPFDACCIPRLWNGYMMYTERSIKPNRPEQNHSLFTVYKHLEAKNGCVSSSSLPKSQLKANLTITWQDTCKWRNGCCCSAVNVNLRLRISRDGYHDTRFKS